MEILKNIVKIKNSLKKIGKYLIKYFSFKNARSLEKPWLIILVIMLIYLLGLLGTAVSVYGYKINSPGIKFFLKIFPIPAVIIDSQAISVTEVYERMDYIRNFNRVSQQETPLENELRTQVINQLIEDYFYRIGTIDAGIFITSAEVEEVYQKNVVEPNGGEEAVANAVESLYGMTIADLKHLIKAQLVKEKVVSDGLEQIDLKMIIVGDEDVAKKVISEIQEGNNFEDAAREYSRDETSRDKGGAVGWVARGQLDDDDFMEKLFDLPIRVLSEEPIVSQFGWAVVKVEDKKGRIKHSIEGWIEDLKNNTRVWRLLK